MRIRLSSDLVIFGTDYTDEAEEYDQSQGYSYGTCRACGERGNCSNDDGYSRTVIDMTTISIHVKVDNITKDLTNDQLNRILTIVFEDMK